MSVQKKLETQLLSAASKSRDVMAQVMKRLNGYQFSDPGLHWIYEGYKKTWAKGEVARFTSLEGMARNEPEASQEPILESLLEVWRSEPTTTIQTDIDSLLQYHKHDVMVKGVDRAVKAMTRGDLDGAQTVLSRLSTETATTSGLVVSPVLDFTDWNAHDEIQGIQTGIKTYDEVTAGGPRPGDLGVIMGVTNMGKSILGLNFGFSGFKHRRRTLHIDSENGLQETRVRYAARATRHPSRSLTRRGLNFSDDFRRWAEKNVERIHNHLRIMHIGIEQASMTEVDAKIAELCADGWTPEQIIFDAMDHVVFEGSQDNAGHVAKRIYTEGKSMAQRHGAAIWAITQAKQEAEGKIATNKHAAWGYDKSRLADSVLTINPGLDDKGHPLPEKLMGDSRCLFVSKARKSAGRFIVPLATDFSTAYVAEALDANRPDEDVADG